MKGSHYVIIGAASLAVVSCVQPYPVPTIGNSPQANVVPAAPARSGQYIALPGQAVQSVSVISGDSLIWQPETAADYLFSVLFF